MAKVIITCGKICSGKSAYAHELCKERRAALLSVDEITLALFGQNAGKKHDEYVEKLEGYLFDKSVELIRTGIDVVMDLGLWTRREREQARSFYESNGIELEIHYLDISDSEWRRRIEARNALLKASKEDFAYHVDEGLAEKCRSIFEEPDDDEVDVWVSFGRMGSGK